MKRKRGLSPAARTSGNDLSVTCEMPIAPWTRRRQWILTGLLGFAWRSCSPLPNCYPSGRRQLQNDRSRTRFSRAFRRSFRDHPSDPSSVPRGHKRGCVRNYLVSCERGSFTWAALREYLVGGLGPGEGVAAVVPAVDEGLDGSDEVGDRGEAAAA